MNAHLKITVDHLIDTILDSKYKDRNIFKGILAPEESTYRETKRNEKFQKENSKEIVRMGQPNEEDGQKGHSKMLSIVVSVKASLWV